MLAALLIALGLGSMDTCAEDHCVSLIQLRGKTDDDVDGTATLGGEEDDALTEVGSVRRIFGGDEEDDGDDDDDGESDEESEDEYEEESENSGEEEDNNESAELPKLALGLHETKQSLEHGAHFASPESTESSTEAAEKRETAGDCHKDEFGDCDDEEDD